MLNMRKLLVWFAVGLGLLAVVPALAQRLTNPQGLEGNDVYLALAVLVLFVCGVAAPACAMAVLVVWRCAHSIVHRGRALAKAWSSHD